MDLKLPLIEAPESVWVSIEAALRKQEGPRRSPVPLWRWAVAAMAVLALASALFYRPGRWIETDARSHKTISVGTIGRMELAPNTKLRIVTERTDEHRFALVRGEIHATISAPPKMFFVETASGTAVDLDCEYTLSTDESGYGLLSVTKGWVSFQWKGLESLVPAGASCRTRRQTGPGVPSFDDAASDFKRALETGDIATVLVLARPRDTLSLWHLLSRANPDDRARVFDRIARLTRIPAGISREQALRLDTQTLTQLKEELAWTW